jgi:DNA-binding CsgD family transcriptional regulator
MLSHDDLKRSFVYVRSRELGMGLERVMSVALVDRSADWHGGLTLYRVENRPFSEVESNALQSMVPVLRGSIRMLQRLRRLEERLLARDALYTYARVEAIFFRHLAVEDDRTVGATDLLRHYFTEAEMGPRLLPVALLERLRRRWIASSHTGVSAPELRERDGRLLRISYLPLSSTLVDWRWAILLEELPSDTHLPEWWIDKLTARERQVVALVIQEHDNTFIADALGCTVGTVKKHLQHIFDKLGVDHRHMLVNQARRHR